MGAKTKIEWSDSTVNPIMGCSGCELRKDHCYAAAMCAHYAGRKGWPKSFAEPEFFRGRLEKAIGWRDLTGVDRPTKSWLNGRPRHIFVNDMSDGFCPDVDPWEWLAPSLPAMHLSPHIWLLLTKWPRRMGAFFKEWAGPIPSNFWLGTSILHQADADSRCADFKSIDAAVKFVSYEPALGPVDWTGWEFVDQIISGGESGPGDRPSHPDWHRVTRDFCQENNIAYFFKQHGRWVEMGQVGALACKSVDNYQRGLLSHGKLDGQAFRQASPWGALGPKMLGVGKKRAGRLLDGQEWNEYPEVRA